VDIQKKLKATFKDIRNKLSENTRGGNAAMTGFVTLFVKGLSICTGLISIPVTSHYLGKEQFGVWLLLSTFMNWISIADLGLTNSLVNFLTTAFVREDKDIAKRAVSSVFFAMVFLCVGLLITIITLSFFLHWEEILNISISYQLQKDARLSITIAMCFFAIKIPLSIPRCIYNAYQQGYIYQMWIGMANLLSFASLFVMQHYQANLPWLLGIFFGMVMLGDILAGIDIFYFRQIWLKPKLVNCERKLIVSLLKVGFQFWIAQISAIVIFQTDLVIVSQLFGVVEVGIYGVLMKLFSTIETVSSSFITPLWPAYNDALAKKDYKWIKTTFWNSILVTFIWSISAGTIVTVMSPTLIKYFIGGDVVLEEGLPLYMLLTYVLLCVSQCIAMLVNGLGKLKLQSFVAPISATANIILSITLGKIIGVKGITLATSICILLFSILLVGGDSLSTLGKKHSKI
jgi:O-antigen/teichoic acid export membrane protein